MEDIFETAGQALLAAGVAFALLSIIMFLFFSMNGSDGVTTVAELVYAALNSILP